MTNPVHKDEVVAYKDAMDAQKLQEIEVSYQVTNAPSSTATPYVDNMINGMVNAHLEAQFNSLPTLTEEEIKVIKTAINTKADQISYMMVHMLDEKHLVHGTHVGSEAPNKICATQYRRCTAVQNKVLKTDKTTCATTSTAANDMMDNPMACA